MRRLFKLNAAPIAALGALTFIAIAAPASAREYEYYRTDVTDYKLICTFDTLSQCQWTVSGRSGVCLRDPFLGGVNDAYAYAYAPGTHLRREGGVT